MWALVLGGCLCMFVFQVDDQMQRVMTRFAARLGGDLRRELAAWQQYGQGFTIAVVAIGVLLLERGERRARLWDFGLAVGLAYGVAQGMKMLIGRPRPRPWFDDARTILGPFGEYPIPTKDGGTKLVHAWDIAGGATTDLWSMPSSHTLMAAVVSVFIAEMYPRLKWLAVGLAVMVGVCRVMFDAHWLTDVIVGGAVGYAVGSVVVGGGWGSRTIAKWQRAKVPSEGSGAEIRR